MCLLVVFGLIGVSIARSNNRSLAWGALAPLVFFVSQLVVYAAADQMTAYVVSIIAGGLTLAVQAAALPAVPVDWDSLD